LEGAKVQFNLYLVCQALTNFLASHFSVFASFFFVMLSCFIYHIIFAGEFSFLDIIEFLLKAEQTYNTQKDEILISEGKGKETFGECVKIMRRI
jgi:hypothetical protein